MNSTDLVAPQPEALTAHLQDVAQRAQAYASASKASNSKRAYSADWHDFTAWCEQHGRVALPATAQTVALYLTERAASCKVSTLERRLTTISLAHGAAHHDNPTKATEVRAVMSGIRRTKGTAPAQKEPILTADLRAMVATLPESVLGGRDRALLLLGFAGAFRRSELVALDVADLSFITEGLVVMIRKSKTDQEQAGRKVGIPYGSRPDTCPVRAVKAWLEQSGIAEGALFRPINRHSQIQSGRLSAYSVGRVVKRTAQAAGLDPKKYAGHSLRSGLATSAAQAGVSERAIMAQTGHKSVVIARRYILEGSLWRENAAAEVGL
jgi:integrase